MVYIVKIANIRLKTLKLTLAKFMKLDTIYRLRAGEYFEVFKHGFDFYYDRPGYFYDEPNNFSSNYFPGGGRIGATQSGDLAIRIGGPKQINIAPVYRLKINYKKGILNTSESNQIIRLFSDRTFITSL